jgi:hypothetical protein
MGLSADSDAIYFTGCKLEKFSNKKELQKFYGNKMEGNPTMCSCIFGPSSSFYLFFGPISFAKPSLFLFTSIWPRESRKGGWRVKGDKNVAE